MKKKDLHSSHTKPLKPLKKALSWNKYADENLKPNVVPTKRQRRPFHPLPQADIAVITWTMAEWLAMQYVFTYESYSNESDIWKPYAKDFYTVYQDLYAHSMIQSVLKKPMTPPSLSDECWGKFCMVKIDAKRVLLIKSSMHLSTDGVTIPLLQFIKQIIEDSKIKLLLTIGTAGGTRTEDALGDVNISNSAHLQLSGELENVSYNEQTFHHSTWKPRIDAIKSAATPFLSSVESLDVLVPGIGYELESKISPEKHAPGINDLTGKLPLLTTNGFVTGYVNGPEGKCPEGKYLGDKYCVVEEDDALLAKVAGENNVQYGSLRNISDGAVNYELPEKLRSTWPSVIYKAKGFDTSVNGAIATWAVIAKGGAQ